MVVSDASIRNNVTISITHVHFFNRSLKKTLYHTINVTTMEEKLFAIRYRINKVTQISGISCIIIIITDALHVAQRIFDSTVHLYQSQSIAIFKDL